MSVVTVKTRSHIWLQIDDLSGGRYLAIPEITSSARHRVRRPFDYPAALGLDHQTFNVRKGVGEIVHEEPKHTPRDHEEIYSPVFWRTTFPSPCDDSTRPSGNQDGYADDEPEQCV